MLVWEVWECFSSGEVAAWIKKMICNSIEAGVFLGNKIKLREHGSKAPWQRSRWCPWSGAEPHPGLPPASLLPRPAGRTELGGKWSAGCY